MGKPVMKLRFAEASSGRLLMKNESGRFLEDFSVAVLFFLGISNFEKKIWTFSSKHLVNFEIAFKSLQIELQKLIF